MDRSFTADEFGRHSHFRLGAQIAFAR